MVVCLHDLASPANKAPARVSFMHQTAENVVEGNLIPLDRTSNPGLTTSPVSAVAEPGDETKVKSLASTLETTPRERNVVQVSTMQQHVGEQPKVSHFAFAPWILGGTFALAFVLSRLDNPVGSFLRSFSAFLFP